MNGTKIPRFWGIHAAPGPFFAKFLACIPFALAIGVYCYFSHQRHLENPQDKILPSLTQMVNATYSMAFVPDKRTGDLLFWKDTAVSLKRIAIGVSISAFVGLMLGMNSALFRGLGAVTTAFITFASIVPPLSLLPIILVSFGVDEFSKIALIVIGGTLMITRSMYREVQSIPREQIIKSVTLGASQLDIVYRIVLPQIMPKLIDTIRIVLGAAWLFLIAAEGYAAKAGLGYRGFLMQRYLAMDVIIPYVLWITLIGFTLDWVLKQTLTGCYRWYCETTK